MVKAESLTQLAFRISPDNSLFIPDRLQDFNFGEGIVEVLKERNFASKNKEIKGNMIFIPDISSNVTVEVNPYNFQVILKQNGIVETPRFGSGVIFIEKSLSEVDQDLLTQKLKKMNNLLKFSSPLYLIVKNDSGFNKKNMKNFLVETKLLRSELSYFPKLTKELSVFETRKYKKAKKVEINLLSLNEEGEFKYPWVQDMFQELIEFYRMHGCYIIDPKKSELYKSLINCKNVKKAFGNLLDGNGIKYIASCGCCYENLLDGTKQKLKDCHQDIHNNLSGEMNWFDQMIKDVCEKKIEVNLYCRCGEFLERHGRCVKKYPRSVAIDFITYCPHCGSDNGNYHEKRTYFKIEGLIKEWNSLVEAKAKRDFKG